MPGALAAMFSATSHFQLAIASGRSAADADKLVAAFSSHSLRAGFATTTAEHDAPGYRNQSPAMVHCTALGSPAEPGDHGCHLLGRESPRP
jgi:hypothetical protein